MIVEAVVYGLDLTDRLGLELWRRTVRDLDQLGLLARSDGAVVLASAAAWEQLERAVADNPTRPCPARGAAGSSCAHPGS